ncbi:hypothetical protein KP509_11G095600 [Ceratopteris richardii]|uniref:Uncharacterized protein n=1 Tax=Ceratopteris richardii TaxID=49495 RepID=A0A8T2TTZ6_CERRI|nr:hypothetical protein KP509_11G095600 [Ceratopteris richardii]
MEERDDANLCQCKNRGTKWVYQIEWMRGPILNIRLLTTLSSPLLRLQYTGNRARTQGHECQEQQLLILIPGDRDLYK